MKDAAIFPITANNQATYHASHVHNTVFIAVHAADRPDQRLAVQQLVEHQPVRLWRGQPRRNLTGFCRRRSSGNWADCGSLVLA